MASSLPETLTITLDGLTILQAIMSFGLILTPGKYRFAYEGFLLLGHVISNIEVRSGKLRIAAIAGLVQHIEKNAVRRFLGFCARYRRIVKDSKMSSSSGKCRKSFQKPKNMSSLPVHTHLDQTAD